MDRSPSFWRCVEKTLAFVFRLDYILFDYPSGRKQQKTTKHKGTKMEISFVPFWLLLWLRLF